MELRKIGGVTIEGICAFIPDEAVENESRVAQATGIVTRRVVPPGTTVVDICVKAAGKVIADTGSKPDEFGAVLFVSFTQHHRMPSAAAQAQDRLHLPTDVIAFDISLACSGWGYGLYVAGLLATQTRKKVLLLDGDVQSAFVDANDRDTASLLSDGGSATVVAPAEAPEPWAFSFMTDGSRGKVLELESGGTIRMDGFGVFKFVATDVVKCIREFMGHVGEADAFVPHQANAYIVRQLAKSIGIPEEKTVISCDSLGNMSSASVPVAIAAKGIRGRLLIAGFGGGLSVSVGSISIAASCPLSVVS